MEWMEFGQDRDVSRRGDGLAYDQADVYVSPLPLCTPTLPLLHKGRNYYCFGTDAYKIAKVGAPGWLGGKSMGLWISGL